MGAAAGVCPMYDQSAAPDRRGIGAKISALAGVEALWFVVLRA
jgi:hypothetical protein